MSTATAVHVQFLRVPVIFSVVIKYFTEAFLPVIDRLFSRGRPLVPVSLTEFDQHINSDCLISVRRHITCISCVLCPADLVLARVRQFMR